MRFLNWSLHNLVYSTLGNSDHQSIFISSLIEAREIAKILKEVKPGILSLYPTNLQSLLPFLSEEIKK